MIFLGYVDDVDKEVDSELVMMVKVVILGDDVDD